MTPSEFDQALLCLTAWRIAGSGNLDVLIAIAQALLNRSKQKSIPQVISELTGTARKLATSNLHPDPRDPVFFQFLSQIELVYSGKLKDLSAGALYFANPHSGVGEVSPGVLSPLVAKVHEFYFYA